MNFIKKKTIWDSGWATLAVIGGIWAVSVCASLGLLYLAVKAVRMAWGG